MGRSDYILGKIQLIFWIPISLQNFWKCHHGGCVLYFITLVRLVTSSRAFCSECILYHRLGKDIPNHIVNFNSYKLCLSDIFDGQEYSITGHNLQLGI